MRPNAGMQSRQWWQLSQGGVVTFGENSAREGGRWAVTGNRWITRNYMRVPSPIQLMWLLFIGFAGSLLYGLFTAVILYTLGGKADAQRYLTLYIGPFNSLVTLGLILATALIVRTSQHLIPDTIESAFAKEDLSEAYWENRRRYFSL